MTFEIIKTDQIYRFSENFACFSWHLLSFIGFVVYTVENKDNACFVPIVLAKIMRVSSQLFWQNETTNVYNDMLE